MNKDKSGESGFSLIEVLAGTFLASAAGIGIYLLRAYVDLFDILEILQKTSLIFALLGVAAWHLKLKLLELTSRPGISLSEQRRLSTIIVGRIKNISILLYYYIVSAALINAFPIIGKSSELTLPLSIIGVMVMTTSLYSGVLILGAFNEMSEFKMLLDRLEFEAKERERLLKKLSC